MNPINNNELVFSTLGIWRKIYIGIIWLITLIFSLGTCVWLFIPEVMGQELGFPISYLIGFMCFNLIYSFWIHTAIVKRKAKQLLALAVIQIIPFMNPISALIFFSIYRISKKEVAL